jgi:hypothetical protein
MSSEELNVGTLDGGDVELDLSLLATIPDEGRLRPCDPGFDDAKLIWNGLIDNLFRAANRNLEPAGYGLP